MKNSIFGSMLIIESGCLANNPAPGKAGSTSRLAVEHYWSGLPEFYRYTALAERGERASPATLRCFRLDYFASQSYFVAQSKQP